MLLFIPQVNKKARDGLKWVVLVFAVLSLAVAVGCSDEPKVVEKIVEVEKVVVEERPVEVVVTATPVPKSEATATTLLLHPRSHVPQLPLLMRLLPLRPHRFHWTLPHQRARQLRFPRPPCLPHRPRYPSKR